MKKTNRYTVTYSVREGSDLREKAFNIEAESYEAAARIAMRQIVPRAKTLVRCTGDRGKSGLFRGYRPLPEGGQTACSPQFHVM